MPQILMAGAVSKFGIVPVCHGTNVGDQIWQQVSQPHDSGLFVSPGLKGVSIEAVDCNQTLTVLDKRA